MLPRHIDIAKDRPIPAAQLTAGDKTGRHGFTPEERNSHVRWTQTEVIWLPSASKTTLWLPGAPHNDHGVAFGASEPGPTSVG